MLNCSASLAMSTSVLKALPGKLDIKRHSPSILYVFEDSISPAIDVKTLLPVIVVVILRINKIELRQYKNKCVSRNGPENFR